MSDSIRAQNPALTELFTIEMLPITACVCPENSSRGTATRSNVRHLRKAELGFLGVVVYTRVHTPRLCGHACSAGLAVLYRGGLRPFRTSWINVGTKFLSENLACKLTGVRPAKKLIPRYGLTPSTVLKRLRPICEDCWTSPCSERL